MANLINAAIPFLGGVYCLLVGFRVVGPKPGVNPKHDAMMVKFGAFFKVAGPVLMLVGVVYFIIGSGGR